MPDNDNVTVTLKLHKIYIAELDKIVRENVGIYSSRTHLLRRIVADYMPSCAKKILDYNGVLGASLVIPAPEETREDKAAREKAQWAADKAEEWAEQDRIEAEEAAEDNIVLHPELQALVDAAVKAHNDALVVERPVVRDARLSACPK